jgi:hypothetical protein
MPRNMWGIALSSACAKEDPIGALRCASEPLAGHHARTSTKKVAGDKVVRLELYQVRLRPRARLLRTILAPIVELAGTPGHGDQVLRCGQKQVSRPLDVRVGDREGNEICGLDPGFVMFISLAFAPRFWADYTSFRGVWAKESLNELTVHPYILGVPCRIPQGRHVLGGLYSWDKLPA